MLYFNSRSYCLWMYVCIQNGKLNFSMYFTSGSSRNGHIDHDQLIDGNSKRKPVSQNQESTTSGKSSHTHTRTHARTHTQTADWKHSSMTFILFGRNVCRTTYVFAHGIGIKRYKRLNKHHNESGTTSKHHGSSGRVTYNAYNVLDQKHVKFINYFAT